MKRNLILAAAWFILGFIILVFFINKLHNQNMFEYSLFNLPVLKNINEKIYTLEEYSFEADKINLIKVLTVNEDINFFPSKDDKFLIKFIGSTGKYPIPEIKQENNCLYITGKKKNDKTFLFRIYKSLKIEIFIPLKKIEIFTESTSADIRIENIVVKNLIVKSISGDLHLKNANIENCLEYNTVSGDIKGEAHIDYFITKTVSGNFKLKLLSEPKQDSQFKTVSGDFYISLHENINGFSCNFNSTSGDYKNFFTKTSAERKIEETYKTENPHFYIKTVSGNCKIKKHKK